MAIVRALCTFPSDLEDSEDVTVNTWGFDCTATEAGVQNVIDALNGFYSSIHGKLSAIMNWGGGVYKFYDMGDTPPRVPFHEENAVVIGTAGTGAMPAEVAICMSFQGIPISGQSQRRRRGRIYLGPLYTGATDSSGVPASTLISTLATAASTFYTAQDGSDWVWCVLSPTGGMNAVPVHDGWFDNAFDTQRRRGRDATSRTVFGD